jgi:hypothetical protein
VQRTIDALQYAAFFGDERRDCAAGKFDVLSIFFKKVCDGSRARASSLGELFAEPSRSNHDA